MDIENIVAEKGNPALLDKLGFCNSNGLFMGMFGLGAELYVRPRERVQMRLDMFAVQDDYLRLFRRRINRCFVADPTGDGSFEDFREDVFARIKDDRATWPESRGYSNMLFENYTHPEFPYDANTVTPVMSQFLVAAERDSELSSYDCYLPVSSDNGNTLNFTLLLDAVLRWCNLVHPAHGSAGFCVFVEPNTETGQKYAYPFMQRYPGLDIHCPVDFSMEVEGAFNRIKSVNWLTVLDDELLAELGGLEAAKPVLEPECVIHAYEGGVVIQAGAVPQLGDTHRDVSMLEPYRKVAQFTKSARFGPYTSSLFRVFPPLVGKEEANKWVARFD